MAQAIQITSINSEELEVIIQKSVSKVLRDWVPPQSLLSPLPEYGTRKEVAKLLRISLPTLDSYIHKGLIQATRISGRIRIKRSEIEKALTEIKSLRYQR